MLADFYNSLPPELKAAILALIVSVVGPLVLRYTQPKARLVWAKPHAFVFGVPPAQGSSNSSLIYTETVFVQNIGRSTAEDIEVHFSNEPAHLQVWPPQQYSTASNPQGHFILGLKTLGPQEYFTIEMLQINVQLPVLVNVRSPLGQAKQLPMAPTRIFPLWFRLTAFGLMMVGVFAIIYWLGLWLLP